MEDRIPGQLECYLEVCCEKDGRYRRWALIVGKECTVKMCFLDEWTWHMTILQSRLEVVCVQTTVCSI